MRTLDDLLTQGVAGRTVLVRSDLNVPLDAGRITDDGRIRASVATISELAAAGARVVVCAHLGRPKGQVKPEYSLAPVAERLGELLGQPVRMATDVVGDSARQTVAELTDGQVALLENVRFSPGETSKDPAELGAFADQLAGLADCYVDDAFGAVHRAHASVSGVAERLPHAAGRLVLTEVDVLRRLTEDVQRPYVMVLGVPRFRTSSGSSRRCWTRWIGCSSVAACASRSLRPTAWTSASRYSRSIRSTP